MAGIFTRKSLQAIVNDETLTPEERTDQIFSLYGRALDDGYVTKQAAAAEKAAAIEDYKAKAQQPQAVNVKESPEYKALSDEYAAYKTRQTARTSDEFKDIKSKFFDSVYDRLDHKEGHKAYADQLADLRKDFEEYFEPTQQNAQQATPGSGIPQFGAPTQGTMPTGADKSFASAWGYTKKG